MGLGLREKIVNDPGIELGLSVCVTLRSDMQWHIALRALGLKLWPGVETAVWPGAEGLRLWPVVETALVRARAHETALVRARAHEIS